MRVQVIFDKHDNQIFRFTGQCIRMTSSTNTFKLFIWNVLSIDGKVTVHSAALHDIESNSLAQAGELHVYDGVWHATLTIELLRIRVGDLVCC